MKKVTFWVNWNYRLGIIRLWAVGMRINILRKKFRNLLVKLKGDYLRCRIRYLQWKLRRREARLNLEG